MITATGNPQRSGSLKGEDMLGTAYKDGNSRNGLHSLDAWTQENMHFVCFLVQVVFSMTTLIFCLVMIGMNIEYSKQYWPIVTIIIGYVMPNAGSFFEYTKNTTIDMLRNQLNAFKARDAAAAAKPGTPASTTIAASSNKRKTELTQNKPVRRSFYALQVVVGVVVMAFCMNELYITTLKVKIQTQCFNQRKLVFNTAADLVKRNKTQSGFIGLVDDKVLQDATGLTELTWDKIRKAVTSQIALPDAVAGPLAELDKATSKAAEDIIQRTIPSPSPSPSPGPNASPSPSPGPNASPSPSPGPNASPSSSYSSSYSSSPSPSPSPSPVGYRRLLSSNATTDAQRVIRLQKAEAPTWDLCSRVLTVDSKEGTKSSMENIYLPIITAINGYFMPRQPDNGRDDDDEPDNDGDTHGGPPGPPGPPSGDKN